MKPITYFDVLAKASPRRLAVIAEELSQLFAENLDKPPAEFDDSVKELEKYVRRPENKFLRVYIANMLGEAQQKPIKTPDDFFRQLDTTLHSYPKYSTDFKDGLPFYKLLQLFMATSSGYSFFTALNVQPYIAGILKAYYEGLGKPESCKYLEYGDVPGNWLSRKAWKALKLDDYNADRTKPHGGFKSWNEFFIRSFKNINHSRTMRLDPTGKLVISPVDGQVFKISEPVLREAAFEIKDEKYYLTDLLDEKADSPLLAPFVDGLAVQVVLMPANYHRWHSPVTGEIKKIKRVPGYFFAQQTPKKDYAGSFPFLSHCNTRTIFFITSKDVGKIALVFVGLTEVSSCVPKKKEGTVLRGEEIGHFQFGGSTCCMLFEKGKIAKLSIEERKEIEVRQDIAKAR